MFGKYNPLNCERVYVDLRCPFCSSSAPQSPSLCRPESTSSLETLHLHLKWELALIHQFNLGFIRTILQVNKAQLLFTGRWFMSCGFTVCGFTGCGFIGGGFTGCGFISCGFTGHGFESHCSPPAGPSCHKCAQTCLETERNLARIWQPRP